jgi:LacI family transcriptional regulator
MSEWESDPVVEPPMPAPLRARATIGEVAALAGVSPTTVSHVFSGRRLVSESTRERVLEAVRELGYRPNNVARNLRTRRSRMVAVIVPDITNPFYGVLTRGLADALQGADYATFVCNTDGTVEREERFLQDVLDRGVDGVVMAAVNVADQSLLAVVETGTPLVCVGTANGDPRIDRVVADDESGSRAVTQHLLQAGARRVAMIQGPSHSGEVRVEGYRNALRQAGKRFRRDFVAHGDWTRQGGHDAMMSLMSVKPRPDAVFCANDLMAIGAMDAAHELDLAVPGDVALAGFDDVEAATLIRPPLTTVRNPSYDTGMAAGRLLLSRISGEYTGGQRVVVLPCPLVVRESA